MGGKKIQHHTAKEIDLKHKAAKMKAGGKGGGNDGKDKRKAPKEGKKDVFIKCSICMSMQPSLKSLEIHHESKHAKIKWDPSIYQTVEDTKQDSSTNVQINKFVPQNIDNFEDNEEDEEKKDKDDGEEVEVEPEDKEDIEQEDK